MTPLVLCLAVLAMPQPIGHPFGELTYCSHETVNGVPQSGKTTLAKARLRSARRVVFATPHPAQYAEEGRRVFLETLEAHPELLDGTFMRLVVPVGDEDDDEDGAEQVTRLVSLLRREAPRRGALVLVLDEVGDYSRNCERVLTKLHRNGHHRGIASVLISQCAVDIPLTCRRTATRVVSLLQTRSEDLDALAREYGEDFAERARTWRRGDPPAVWTLPTLDGGRS